MDPLKLDPVSLLLHASGPVLAVNVLLLSAAGLVWIVAVLKFLHLARITSAEAAFEREASQVAGAAQLFSLAGAHPEAPGARVVLELARRAGSPRLLEAVAKRAVVDESQRASYLSSLLASVGSAGPFVGLFGTVWGIMDAFLRIGREKSASLPVVAPAIGEALIATAVGLFAAIPAVLFYNAISRRVDALVDGLAAASEGWVALAEAEPRRAVAARPEPAAAFVTPIPLPSRG